MEDDVTVRRQSSVTRLRSYERGSTAVQHQEGKTAAAVGLLLRTSHSSTEAFFFTVNFIRVGKFLPLALSVAYARRKDRSSSVQRDIQHVISVVRIEEASIDRVAFLRAEGKSMLGRR